MFLDFAFSWASQNPDLALSLFLSGIENLLIDQTLCDRDAYYSEIVFPKLVFTSFTPTLLPSFHLFLC
jgi:hypothetical protein